MVERKDVKVVCTNRKARHEFEVDEVYEAGIVLRGSEVKSLRDGRASLADSYAWLRDGEVFLENFHISAYQPASRENTDPLRPKKLLLHKREILRLIGKTRQKGFTLVPLRMYFTKGRAKAEIALARRKKLYDKREDIKKKAAERELRRGE